MIHRDGDPTIAGQKRTLPWHSLRSDVLLIHDRVHYYATADPPETTYALPDRIVMHKHEYFRDQHEYRFAFGIHSDVFDYERVQWTLESRGTTSQRRELNESDHRLKIWIGSLTDCSNLAANRIRSCDRLDSIVGAFHGVAPRIGKPYGVYGE